MSNRNELIGQVRSAMRRLTTEIDGLDECAAAHFGVNRTDLRVIDTLRSRGPLTASELASAVGLTSGGLSIALERLERLGSAAAPPTPTTGAASSSTRPRPSRPSSRKFSAGSASA